jgi:hypothetical protein
VVADVLALPSSWIQDRNLCHLVLIILAYNGIHQPHFLTKWHQSASSEERRRFHIFYFVDDKYEPPSPARDDKYSNTIFDLNQTDATKSTSNVMRLHSDADHRWGEPGIVALHRDIVRQAICHLSSLKFDVAVRHWFLASGHCVPVKPINWFFHSPRFQPHINIFANDRERMKKFEEQMKLYLRTFSDGTKAEIDTVTVLNGVKIRSGVQWIVMTNESAVAYSKDDETNRKFVSLCERVDKHLVNEINPNGRHGCPVTDEWLPFEIIRQRIPMPRGCFDVTPITEFYFLNVDDTGPCEWKSTTELIQIPDGSSRKAHDQGKTMKKTLAQVLILAAEDKQTGFFRKVASSADICSLVTDDFKFIVDMPTPSASSSSSSLSSSSLSSSSSASTASVAPSVFTAMASASSSSSTVDAEFADKPADGNRFVVTFVHFAHDTVLCIFNCCFVLS